MAQLRADLRWVGALTALTALLLAWTFTTHVALGDAPESVAGIASLGIVHAPGYPLYVVLGHLFMDLFPVGGIAFRVNLFSCVCGELDVILTFAVARRLGASRGASVLGGLVLVTSGSFWFFSDYAKHYPLSLLVVLLSFAVVLDWRAAGGSWRLALAGAVVGLGMGTSPQFDLLVVPALALGILWRRPFRLTHVLAPVMTGILGLVMVFGFLMVRASEHPAVDWGTPTTVSASLRLLESKDFNPGHSPQPSGAPGSAHQAPTHLTYRDAVGIPARLITASVAASRVMGPVALPLAVLGLVVEIRRRRRVESWMLAGWFASAALPSLVLVGPRHFLSAVDATDQMGQFYLPEMAMVAVGVALGLDALVRWMAPESAAASRRGRRRRPRGPVEELLQWLRRLRAERPGVIQVTLLALLGAVVVLPSVLVHRHWADQHSPPYATQIAEGVLPRLPPHALLLVNGSEQGFPYLYEQVVHRERPDVYVLPTDTIGVDWGRTKIDRVFGYSGFIRGQTLAKLTAGFALYEMPKRPVYADIDLAQKVGPYVGYVADGLVARLVKGTGAQPIGPQKLAAVVDSLPSQGVYSSAAVWPNLLLLHLYATARLELARQYQRVGDNSAIVQQLRLVLGVEPWNPVALHAMKLFGSHP